ncbi:MAG: hypothetical protein GXZ04_08610 [Clostridiales bacterium]|nr:hypothetical protein [Clostridiales bacterium]
MAFLTAKGEQLYGYHPVQGAVYPFSLRDGLQMGAAIPLDLFDMSVSDGVMTLPYQPHQFLVFEERFYLLFHQDAEGGMDGRLLSFDLLGLDRKDINIPLVRQLAPYQEGQLLCLAEKEAGIVGPGQLHVFLPKDGSLTALGRTGQQLKAFGAGLAYDPDSQDVYYQSGSQLFVWHAEGKDSLVAHLGSEFMLPGSGMVLIRPGLLAFGHGLGISIRQTKPPQLDTRELVIRGGYPDRQHELAASLMPDAHIRFIETTYQSTALQKALILGDDSFDIYQLGAQDINTKSLMEKGYALPLQGEVISRHMARLHPVLCDMGTLNGKTMLLPVDLRLMPLYINQGLFEELGLRIPRSLEELLAFITDYPQDAEVPLFEEPPTQDELLNLASTLWYARSKRMGVPLRFDEPAFLSVLEALGATPNFPQRDLLQDSRAALFPYGNELNFSYWSSYRAFSRQMEPLFLSFLADEEPLVIGTLTLLAISPHSHQQLTALRYLENKLLSMDDLHCASMYLQAPKGIKNPGFDQLIKAGKPT